MCIIRYCIDKEMNYYINKNKSDSNINSDTIRCYSNSSDSGWYHYKYNIDNESINDDDYNINNNDSNDIS